MTTPGLAASRPLPPPARMRVLHVLARPVLWARGFLGRHLSVRWKLTLWYAVMYLLTLVLIGMAFARLLDFQTQSSVDSGLRATSAQVTRQLAAPPPSRPGSYLSHHQSACAGESASVQLYCVAVQQVLNRFSRRLSAPGQFVQAELFGVQGAGHQLTAASVNGDSIGLINPAWLVRAFQPGSAPQFHEWVLRGGNNVRAYFVRFTPPPALAAQGVVGVAEVFQVTHTYVEIQHTITVILLLGLPIGLLLSLLMGWVIARAALRPIARISRKVQTIGESRDLSRRLNFEGPSDEVSRLADTFDGMMDRIEGVFAQQKRFIGDASHELRTPLTAIRGNADLLAMAPPEEYGLCIAAIRRESERMSRLIGDLLLLAETDVSERVVHLQPMQLEDVLADVYRSAALLAGSKVTVTFSPCEEVAIQGDPDRLKQVFLNLLDNAIKFTPEGGAVTMSLRRRGNEAVIRVTDTGVGIPPQEQEAIFRRFYRVEAARSTRGSGLGLAICASIVEAHGGTIGVTGKPGQGSTFTVRLPILVTPAPPGARFQEPAPEI
jgi:two-component system, OmpR family, sensor kinase